MEQMLLEHRRSTEAILSLVETLKNQQITAVRPLGNGLGNDFPTISQTNLAEIVKKVAVATPSKMELAIDWLKTHPEDVVLTGRELEAARLPMGVKISYKTWNDAKKQIT